MFFCPAPIVQAAPPLVRAPLVGIPFSRQDCRHRARLSTASPAFWPARVPPVLASVQTAWAPRGRTLVGVKFKHKNKF